MKAYYDLFQCWVQYRVGFILLLYYNYMIFFLFFFRCIYVDVCLRNVNQYYRKKDIKRHLHFHTLAITPMDITIPDPTVRILVAPPPPSISHSSDLGCVGGQRIMFLGRFLV